MSLEGDDTKTISLADHKKQMARAASKRIGEVKREGREALRVESERSAMLERRLAALEQGLTPAKQGATKDPDATPNSSDYQYGELDVKYIKDLASFEARKEIKAAEDRRAATARKQTDKAREAQFEERAASLVEAGREKYDDWDDTVMEHPVITTHLTQVMHDLLLESDPNVSRDIAHHLATHPKEAREMYGKPPAQQAAYFGRLEARFTAPSSSDATTKTSVVTTKAPALPSRTARGAGGNSQATGDTSDFSAFERLAMQR